LPFIFSFFLCVYVTSLLISEEMSCMVPFRFFFVCFFALALLIAPGPLVEFVTVFDHRRTALSSQWNQGDSLHSAFLFDFPLTPQLNRPLLGELFATRIVFIFSDSFAGHYFDLSLRSLFFSIAPRLRHARISFPTPFSCVILLFFLFGLIFLAYPLN